MFGWINRGWKFVRGLPRDTSQLIHTIFHAVVGWATNIFHIVGAAWDDLANMFHHWAVITRQFMDSVFGQIAKLVLHTIPDLARTLTRDIKGVASDLMDLTRLAARWVDDAAKHAEARLQDGLRWLESHVITPVIRDLAGALDWIKNRGDVIWQLLHDGEYIAALAFRFLIAQWLVLLRHYATDALRWLLGSGTSATLSIARIVEEAITEVL